MLFKSRELLVACVAAVVGVGSVVLLGALGWPGASFDCGAHPCYCELPRPGLVRQLGNTWSNLGPVIMGIVVAFWSARHRVTREAAHESAPGLAVVGLLFPPVLVFQGVGSMYFHGGLTTWGSAVDAMSMFATTGLLFATNLHRMGRVGPRGLVATWVGLMLAGLALGFISTTAVTDLIFLVVLSILISEIWLNHRRLTRTPALFRIGIWLHIAGVVVWFLSASDALPLCAPDVPWQGHALWHLTAGGAVGLFALHALRNPGAALKLAHA